MGRLDTLSALVMALTLGAGPALAGDINWGGNYVAAQSWSGPFLGGNIGFAWNSDESAIVTANATDTLGTPQADSNGLFSGVQAGYNLVNSGFLFGAIADIQAAYISGSVNGTAYSVPSHEEVTYQNSQFVEYYGTVRGRAGYILGNILFYSTGGFAYGEVTDKISQASISSLSLRKDQFQTGWVLGGGIEYKLGPWWSISQDYQHIDLGSETLKGPSSYVSDLYWSNNIRNSYETIRMGLNFHFPAVASWPASEDRTPYKP